MKRKQRYVILWLFLSANAIILIIIACVLYPFITYGNFAKDTESIIWGIGQIFAEIISILLACKWLGMLKISDIFAPIRVSYPSLIYIILFSVLCILGAEILTSLLDLPDTLELNNTIKKSPFMYVFICLIGPIMEEIISRGAIQGFLLRQSVAPRYAIVISALIFGVTHMNPAQIPITTIVGLMLGILYWKTGSLILPMFIHIANNFISMFVEDMSTVNYICLFGGTIPTLAIMICCLLLSIVFCWKFIKSTPTLFDYT